MVFIIVILAAALVILAAAHVIYRRQVKDLGRQLRFINDNDTRQRPAVDINRPELQALADETARLADRLRDIEVTHLRQDEALRETIANISHDIRTPLTSLDGYFQLLTSEEVPPEMMPNPEILPDPGKVRKLFTPERARRMLDAAENLLAALHTNVNDELALRTFCLSINLLLPKSRS